MKCPKCEFEMEQGVLVNGGQNWTPPLSKFVQFLNFSIGERVIAWKCPKCKKIELAAE